MARIFISYARKYEEFARKLASSLSLNGASIWLDVKDIPAGMNWSSAVQEGLDTADLMIVIITPESMASQNVEHEWQYFFDEKKPVIPILFVPAKIHYQLRRLQYIDFHKEDYDTAYQKLLTELMVKGIRLWSRSSNSSSSDFLRDEHKNEVTMHGIGTNHKPIPLAIITTLLNPKVIIPLLVALIGLLGVVFPVLFQSIREDHFIAATGTTQAQLSATALAKQTLIAVAPTSAAVTASPSETSTQTPTLLPSDISTDFLPASATSAPIETTRPTETATSTIEPIITKTATSNTSAINATVNIISTSVILTEGCNNSFNIPMILVPETIFFMGLSDDQAGPSNERPGRNVTVTSFCIDVYEVTNARYTNCVNDGACTLPQREDSALFTEYFSSPNFARFPVINVTWTQAQEYCEYRGGRLPTEAEWELVARHDPITGEMRTYPWGTQSPNASRANYLGRGIGDAIEVGQHPDGASPYGVLDLSGNVAEWVFDWFGAYSSQNVINPTGPENGTQRVVRGGSYASDSEGVRGGYRGRQSPSIESEHIGFRCAVPRR